MEGVKGRGGRKGRRGDSYGLRLERLHGYVTWWLGVIMMLKGHWTTSSSNFFQKRLGSLYQ